MASRQIGNVALPGHQVKPRAVAAGPAFWFPTGSLWWREMVRFYRQRGRVAGTLGTPLLFWLLIGAGFGDSFRAGATGTGYLQYFFPGTILLTALFTSVFSNMSVIEDRAEGFLLSVLVAPISRTAIVLGKVLGGATQAMLQGLILVALTPLLGVKLGPAQLLEAAGVLFLLSFALTAAGFYFAWRLDSVQGFHGVMNLLLLPMWLLSGALFPVSGAHSWLGWVMRVNPLTYGMTALRHALYGSQAADGPSLAVSVGVTAAFGLAALAAGLRVVWEPPA